MAADTADEPPPSPHGADNLSPSDSYATAHHDNNTNAHGPGDSHSGTSDKDSTPEGCYYWSGNFIDRLCMGRFGLLSQASDFSGGAIDGRESEGWTGEPTGLTTGLNCGTRGAAENCADRKSRTPDEPKVLARCIAGADIPGDDRQKAYAVLEKPQAQKPGRSTDIISGCSDPNDHAHDTLKKLHSLEHRLDTLISCLQTEATARASMSALYDHEFMRIGYDMFVTKNNIDGLTAITQQNEAKTVEGGCERCMAVEDKISLLQAVTNEEHKRRAALRLFVNQLEALTEALGKVRVRTDQRLLAVESSAAGLVCLRGKLNSLSAEITEARKGCEHRGVLLQPRPLTETVREILADFSGQLSELRTHVKTPPIYPPQLGAETIRGLLADLEKSAQAASSASVDNILLRLQVVEQRKNTAKPDTGPANAQQGPTNILALADVQRRLQALEQPACGTIKHQLEELRATTTAYHADIDHANSRIAELESIVRDGGLNDSRLVDMELQLMCLDTRLSTAESSPPQSIARNELEERVLSTTFDALVKRTHSRLDFLEHCLPRSLNRLRETQQQLDELKREHDDLLTKHFDLAATYADDRLAQKDAIKRLENTVEGLPSRADVTRLDPNDLYGRLNDAADFDAEVVERVDSIEAHVGLPARGNSARRSLFAAGGGGGRGGRGRRGSKRAPGWGWGRGGYTAYDERTAAEISGPAAAIRM